MLLCPSRRGEALRGERLRPGVLVELGGRGGGPSSLGTVEGESSISPIQEGGKELTFDSSEPRAASSFANRLSRSVIGYVAPGSITSSLPSLAPPVSLAVDDSPIFNLSNRSDHSSSSFSTSSLATPSIAPNLSFSPLSSPAKSKTGRGGKTDFLVVVRFEGLEGPAAGALAISCSTCANSAFNLLSFAAVDSRRRSSSVSESDERVCVRMGGRRYDCSARQLVSLDYAVEMLAYLVFGRISAELYFGPVDR